MLRVGIILQFGKHHLREEQLDAIDAGIPDTQAIGKLGLLQSVNRTVNTSNRSSSANSSLGTHSSSLVG